MDHDLIHQEIFVHVGGGVQKAPISYRFFHDRVANLLENRYCALVSGGHGPLLSSRAFLMPGIPTMISDDQP